MLFFKQLVMTKIRWKSQNDYCAPNVKGSWPGCPDSINSPAELN